MTISDVKILTPLLKEFRERCEYICRKLVKIHYNFEYMTDFYIKDDTVIRLFQGNPIVYGGGGIETYLNLFP